MWSRLMPESVKQKLSTASTPFWPGSCPNSTNLPTHKQQQTPAAGEQNRKKRKNSKSNHSKANKQCKTQKKKEKGKWEM